MAYDLLLFMQRIELEKEIIGTGLLKKQKRPNEIGFFKKLLSNN